MVVVASLTATMTLASMYVGVVAAALVAAVALRNVPVKALHGIQGTLFVMVMAVAAAVEFLTATMALALIDIEVAANVGVVALAVVEIVVVVVVVVVVAMPLPTALLRLLIANP